MKNWKLLMMGFALISTIGFTSCSDDEDDDETPEDDVPLLSIDLFQVNEVAPGDSIKLQLTSSVSKGKLTKVTLQALAGSEDIVPEDLMEIELDEDRDVRTYMIPVPETAEDGSEINITAKAFTKSTETTKTAVVTVNSGVVGFGKLFSGEVWHIGSSAPGAFDLKEGSPRTSGDDDNEKDFIDQSAVGAAITGELAVGEGTGTDYVVVDGLSTDNLNDVAVKAAYDAGNKVTTATVSTGDVLIVNVRGEELRVVEFTNVDSSDDTNTGGDKGNTGVYKFDVFGVEE